MTALDAKIVPGFALVAAWLDLDARLAAADLVLTGEGTFDDSSLSGKGPGEVIRRAQALGKPVHVFAGRVEPSGTEAACTCHAITPSEITGETALRRGAEFLEQAVRAAALA
jgi:glycerate kinase